jgi:hypothetical protein
MKLRFLALAALLAAFTVPVAMADPTVTLIGAPSLTLDETSSNTVKVDNVILTLTTGTVLEYDQILATGGGVGPVI